MSGAAEPIPKPSCVTGFIETTWGFRATSTMSSIPKKPTPSSQRTTGVVRRTSSISGLGQLDVQRPVRLVDDERPQLRAHLVERQSRPRRRASAALPTGRSFNYMLGFDGRDNGRSEGPDGARHRRRPRPRTGDLRGPGTRRRRRRRDRPVGPRRDGRRGRATRAARDRLRRRRPRSGVRSTRSCARGVTAFGGLDIVVANAGISNWSTLLGDDRGPVADDDRRQPERRVADVQGGGAGADRAGPRRIVDRDQLGGGLKALPGQAHYSAAKHGVVGLVRVGRDRARPVRHPRELGAPVGHQHAARAGSARRRDARGEPDVRGLVRFDPAVARARRSRRTSPTRSCGSRPTRRAASPASSFPVDKGATTV